MIVTYTANGWQVVTQRAHGILAAQLAAHWRVKDRPARWMETVLAIAEHDDAEVELDGETLLTQTGGPLNFDMKVFELNHCRKLAALTQTKSRYITLLTSLHMEFLYRKDAAENKEAETFLAEQRKLRDTLHHALNLEEAELVRIYDLLEWSDACSLLLCQSKLQPEKRKLEISTGPDKKMYHLVQVDDETISIDPWPFEEKTFTINFEWRLIKQIQFSSSAQFRNAFLEAPVTETVWTVRQQKTPVKTKKV